MCEKGFQTRLREFLISDRLCVISFMDCTFYDEEFSFEAYGTRSIAAMRKQYH